MPLSPDGRPLADFGTRLLSHLIDGALLGAASMVLLLPFMFWFMTRWMDRLETYSNTYAQPDSSMVWNDFFLPFLMFEIVYVVVLLAAYYVYYVEMMYRSGQTFGKKWLKLKVVPLEPGATLTRGRAAKRYLVEFVAGAIVPFFSLVDGLWQLWDKPYQQTLHDKAAGTVVIKVAP